MLTQKDRHKEFLQLESSGGIVLMFATVLASLVSNSFLHPGYSGVLDRPLLLWINDGLMAIFFFLIALELKREVMVSQLSSREQIVLPMVGASND